MLAERLPGLLAVYRVGSFGTDAQLPDSDIDLGLQAERPLDPVELFDLAGELATIVRREVDLVDLITCSTVMRAQVIATGERLLCRDEFRCESFADMAFSRYVHLNEARRRILEDILARGSVHGG
jgi:predicted nucleotidyltransferase